MERLKKSRSGHSGAITRVYNKRIKIQDNDPSTFDISNLKRQLESVIASDSHFMKIHDQICESYIRTTDDTLDAETLGQHEDSVAKTASLIEQLVAIHDIHASATDLKQRIEAVEQAIESSSENNFDEELQTLMLEESQIRSDLKSSTISSTHPVRVLYRELMPKLITLRVQRQVIPVLATSESSFSDRRRFIFSSGSPS